MLEKDSDLSKFPKSPSLRHIVGQWMTSVGIGNAMRSNHKSRHSVVGHMPEGVLAPVVVPTGMASEYRGESENGCPDRGDHHGERPNGAILVCPWNDGMPSGNGDGVLALDLGEDFWEQKLPVCLGGVTTCHGTGCVLHPEEWLYEWWPVGL